MIYVIEPNIMSCKLMSYTMYYNLLCTIFDFSFIVSNILQHMCSSISTYVHEF